jgi:predicted N-formylglutamate amidohydrolase
MWKPALAILARAASCKLPLGNPNFKISLELISFCIAFGLGPRVTLGGLFDSRDRARFSIAAAAKPTFSFSIWQNHPWRMAQENRESLSLFFFAQLNNYLHVTYLAVIRSCRNAAIINGLKC